jgi:Mg-chelatase subunit ChlD
LSEKQGLGTDEKLRELYFTRLSDSVTLPERDALLVREILDRARATMKHVPRPTLMRSESFARHPWNELDLEASLDRSAALDNPEDLRVSVRTPRPFSCVAMLDSSSSMSGDKHLLASIAVAVLLLQSEIEEVGLVLFHSRTQVVKHLGEKIAPERTVLKFLQTRPRGFTNITQGLKVGWKEASAHSKRRVGLLMTDGRYTEGGDPLEAAAQFDFLAVLHLHGPGSSLEASQAMAAKGKGICLEVNEFAHLPQQLYNTLRQITLR